MVAPMMQQPPWQMRQPQQPQYMQWAPQGMVSSPDLWQQAQGAQAVQPWQQNFATTTASLATPWQQATAGWQQPTPQQIAGARTATNNGGMYGTLPDTWEAGNFQPQWEYQRAAPDPRVALGGGGVTTNTTGLNNGSAPNNPVGLSQGVVTPTPGLNNGGDSSWSGRTAGFTGSTYAGLQGKFDPWGNWGRYGPRQNGAEKHVVTGGDGHESDVDRVYRWTNDILRSMGYAGGENAPPDLRTRIFLANVERLKSEYRNSNTPWETSDFYNMDQQLTADGTPPGQLGGTPGGGTTAPGGGGAGGGTAPGAGGGTTRNFGQFNTNDLAFALQQARQDPDAAAILLRMAQGQTGRPLGRLAGDRSDMYGKAFQTALNLAGMDGMGDLQGMANGFLQNAVQGNNLLGYGSELGRKVAGMNWDGVDSATMEQALRAGMAMQGLNMGSLGGAVQSGRLNDILYADLERGLRDTGYDQRNFSDLLANSPFARVMANYGR